ncbi:MAG: CNNM domain-containing protein [candidate division WOR-3 bacterium]|nr:CNNM domain-containing protein [candidate division WOR-3 bacterium]
MILVFIAFGLVLLMGIFTATETGFLCVDKTKVLALAKEKRYWAEAINNFQKKPAEFFSTILVCEDFLLVIASNLMAIYFIENHGEEFVLLSTILLSIFSLIFGQLIPKSIALLYPEKTLVITIRIISFFKTLLFPVVVLFAWFSQSLATIFKIKATTEIIRRQDIVFAISEYEKDTSILAARLFDFSHRKVSDIMVPIDIAVVYKKGEDFNKFCIESKQLFRFIPVLDPLTSEIVGVINTRDYFFSGKIEMKPPYFVGENEKCMQVFLKMKERNEHLAVVQSSHNKTVGIITIYDLIEELTGSIREER